MISLGVEDGDEIGVTDDVIAAGGMLALTIKYTD